MTCWLLLTVCTVGAQERESGGSAGSSKVGLAEVVELHDNALRSFHTVDAVASLVLDDFDGSRASGLETVKKGSTLGTFRWTKRGNVERFRSERYKADTQGMQKKLYGDVLRDGRTQKSLIGWDPQRTTPLEPTYQRGVRGAEEPQNRNLPSEVTDVPATFLLWPRLRGNDDRRTLKELVAVSPDAKFVGQADVNGRPAWRLRIRHPGLKDSAGEDYLDVFVDQKNYLISKVSAQNRTKGPKGTVETFEIRSEVTQFKDCGDGLEFPAETKETLFLPGREKPAAASRGTIVSLVANAPLPEDALSFHWPKNLVLRKLPLTKDNRVPLALIGDNDHVVMEIRTPQEARRFRDLYGAPETSPPAAGGARFSTRTVLIAAAPAALIVGLILWRRYFRRGA